MKKAIGQEIVIPPVPVGALFQISGELQERSEYGGFQNCCWNVPGHVYYRGSNYMCEGASLGIAVSCMRSSFRRGRGKLKRKASAVGRWSWSDLYQKRSAGVACGSHVELSRSSVSFVTGHNFNTAHSLAYQKQKSVDDFRTLPTVRRQKLFVTGHE